MLGFTLVNKALLPSALGSCNRSDYPGKGCWSPFWGLYHYCHREFGPMMSDQTHLQVMISWQLCSSQEPLVAGQMRCYKSGLMVIVIDKPRTGCPPGRRPWEQTALLAALGVHQRSWWRWAGGGLSGPRRQDVTQYLEWQCVCLCLWTNSLHMSVLPHFPTQTHDFNLLLLSGTVLHTNHGSS